MWWHVVLSPYLFYLQSPNGLGCWPTFHMLTAFWTSSSVGGLSRSYAHFLKKGCLLSYCWVLKVLYIFGVPVPSLDIAYKYFLPVSGFSFHSFKQWTLCFNVHKYNSTGTQTRSFAYPLSVANFTLHQHSCDRAQLAAKPKIFTSCPFPEKFTDPWFRASSPGPP